MSNVIIDPAYLTALIHEVPTRRIVALMHFDDEDPTPVDFVPARHPRGTQPPIGDEYSESKAAITRNLRRR